mgnify:CR=1 FL=1
MSDAAAQGGQTPSRTHDALAAGLGAAGLGLLAASPWLVDRSGPDPFYKGPLIFPLIALAVMVAGALPAAVRLLRPGGSWRVDGRGLPWPALRLFLLLCLFPTAVVVAGVEATAFLFVAVGLPLVGSRRPLTVVLVAALVSLAIHLAFRSLLDIWFPTPLVADWFGS